MATRKKDWHWRVLNSGTKFSLSRDSNPVTCSNCNSKIDRHCRISNSETLTSAPVQLELKKNVRHSRDSNTGTWVGFEPRDFVQLQLEYWWVLVGIELRALPAPLLNLNSRKILDILGIRTQWLVPNTRFYTSHPSYSSSSVKVEPGHDAAIFFFVL